MSESTFLAVVVFGMLAMIGALIYVYRLIMQPSVGAEPSHEDLVAILDGLLELQAETYRTRLDSCGIPAFVRNSHIAPSLGYRPVVGWEVRVRYGDRLAAEECLDMTLLTSEETPDGVEAP